MNTMFPDEKGLSAMGGSYVLAFDTANEVIAIGLGLLDADARQVQAVSTLQVQAHRASNTRLIPEIEGLLAQAGIERGEVACIVCGRGPGSFTGVRIAMATAKGIASALQVPLVGVSSLDAVAWEAWAQQVRGKVLVAADAMRHEVYPVRYRLDECGIARLDADSVVKVDAFVESAAGQNADSGADAGDAAPLFIAGDALAKYAELFAPLGTLLPDGVWAPTGRGLLLALQAAWRADEVDPLDAVRHHPAYALPVYTRLSDAEEAERVRLRASAQAAVSRDSKHVTMNDTAISNARGNDQGLVFKPLDSAHVALLADLDAQLLPADAWSAASMADELGRSNRSWWCAYAADPQAPLAADAPLLGYAGVLVADGDAQILKVAVAPQARRQGIARTLLLRVLDDARNLGAATCSLEVRASNLGAQALYEALGLTRVGVRPGYYPDREDAVIYQGAIARVAGINAVGGVEGMVAESADGKSSAAAEDVQDAACTAVDAAAAAAVLADVARPLIFAIESSCDETAAAIVDGTGAILASVVASQIDFHARFGGVVPEIASRKHIEAICGVCEACFEAAGAQLGLPQGAALRWEDMDAVAVTYAPGLLGALVVGVAFAKGAAWASGKPFIGVNHLEGHLYANKIGVPEGQPPFEPPAVVSLVSGGNTLLVHMRDWGDYHTLGATIDDAVGEAFDKVAKALGLGYPGGPIISKYAKEGNPAAIAFPRAMLHSGDLQFSLSGLKTAVVSYINGERVAGREPDIADVCASFQQAVIDVQVAKVATALQQTGAPTFCLGGGVAANPALRGAYQKLCAKKHVRLVLPPLSACGDNAAMIALVALDRYRQGRFFDFSADALAHTDLDEPY